MTTTDDPSRERPSFEPGHEAPVPIREWLKALVFVGGVIVVVTALIIWFTFTFFFRSCGVVPCGYGEAEGSPYRGCGDRR